VRRRPRARVQPSVVYQGAACILQAANASGRIRTLDRLSRSWVNWSLFFSSYTPLFVLLGIRSVGKSATLVTISGVLIVLGCVGTVAFLLSTTRKPAGRYELLDVESRDADVAAYAATYLLPFITVTEGGWREVISLAAFVAFLGVVYTRSRLIYVNPVLFVMGWHLWRVVPKTEGAADTEDTVRWPRYLLADTRSLRPRMTITAHPIGDDLLILEKTTDS
jgi:hypothetical protein